MVGLRCYLGGLGDTLAEHLNLEVPVCRVECHRHREELAREAVALLLWTSSHRCLLATACRGVG